MHIPDGILSLPVILVFWVISLVTSGIALKKFRQVFDAKKIPVYLALGVFVFVMQMIDFPVPGGTSVHLIGGALLALLLGFSPAVVIMAAILIIQAFFLHDGGVIALGVNLFNMAILAPLAAVTVKNYLMKFKAFNPELTGSFIAPVIAVFAASFLVALQLGFPGTGVNLAAVLSANIYWALIESLISVAIIAGSIGFMPALFAAKTSA